MQNSFRNFQLVIFAVCVVGFARTATAQYGVSNARSVAMAGAYTALARGVEAPLWNPANLGLKANRVYRLNLVSFGLGIHNNSFDKSQYELYNGSTWTEKDKQDILNAIPDEGLNFDFDTEVQAFGLSLGSFALTATANSASDFTLSKDIADLVLNGNEMDRTYNIGDTDGVGWGVASIAFSGGFNIHKSGLMEVAVGGSLKYLRGIAYAEVVEASSVVTTNIDGLHGNGRLVIDRALGGSGMGLDLGAAAKLDTRWSASFALTNLINSVNWSNDTKRLTYTFSADSVSIQAIDESDIDSVVVNSDDETDIDAFSTSLPRQMRMGIARTGKRLILAFDYIQGLNNGGAISTTPRLAFGSEFRPIGFLPLRAGMAFGGKRGLSGSFGFGFDLSLFSLNFAVANKGGMFSGRGAAFAFDWMFRF